MVMYNGVNISNIKQVMFLIMEDRRMDTPLFDILLAEP